MSLNKNEKNLLEAVGNMLQQDIALGLSAHDNDDQEYLSTQRGYEYLHNQIEEMFALKAAELTHTDGVCQAFHKVHSYKYLDDPSFKTAMQKEMVAQGIPKDERETAIGWVDDIVQEVSQEQDEWAEKDYGFHPDLDEVIDVSQPEVENDEFDVEHVDDWPEESNVEWQRGEASPGHTPDESQNSKNRPR